MISNKNGKSAFYKNLRYTQDVAIASKSGIKLLPKAPAVYGVIVDPKNF